MVTARSVFDPSVTGTVFVQITDAATLEFVPFCFAQDRPPFEFVDRVNLSILNAVDTLQYTFSVTGGLTVIRAR